MSGRSVFYLILLAYVLLKQAVYFKSTLCGLVIAVSQLAILLCRVLMKINCLPWEWYRI